ncbi:MAG: hypothetical protein CVT67_05400 [Actinobacteria bacterium HGW-Actinobacteria-7]|jgi:hypothetical protein|nr:MAG: hypothetical protein CVT67_05400 [Actinobacteria bacterium HGW-Actinobacteria-7]
MVATRPHIPRHLTAVVDRLLQDFRVVVITGPRQVGKSTLAQAVLRGRPGTYLTLDQPDIRERALADPTGLVNAGNEGTTVIDEVQLAPELLRAVKLAVDRDERPGAFLLTGSANLLRMRDVSETLAGRAAYVELPPLTLSERVGLPAPLSIDAAFTAPSAEEFLASIPLPSGASTAVLRDQLCDAVIEGGMPGVIGMGSEPRRNWYSAYLSTFVERDLWQLGRVDDLLAFRRLYSLALLRTSGLLNRADLASDAALDQRTVNRYLDLLDLGYQTRMLAPFSANLGKRLVKMPKVYARDSGMAAHVMRIDAWAAAESAGLSGQLFETWMLGELSALESLSASASTMHFWRTAAGSEVDMLLERGTSLVGVEFKSSSTVRWNDTRGLRALRDSMGDHFRMGVIAYLGEEIRVLDDRICAVPAWALVGGTAAAAARTDLGGASIGREEPLGSLEAARLSAGMRIAQVAELLGVDEASVTGWEASGYEDAPLRVVRTLAETLGVTVRLG